MGRKHKQGGGTACVLLAEPRTNTPCRNEGLDLGSRGRAFQKGAGEGRRQEAFRQGGDLLKTVLCNGKSVRREQDRLGQGVSHRVGLAHSGHQGTDFTSGLSREEGRDWG